VVTGSVRQSLGRPVGARGRFSQQFIEDMRLSWEKHGATVMDRVAVEYPDRYLGIAAHLIPREIEATISASVGSLSAEDLAILQAIREAIPDANSRSPAEVLSYVREALRAHSAKTLIDVSAVYETAGADGREAN
jgi:hypothetical protein